MRFVQREDWGAPAASPAARIASTRGVKVHYLGTPYTSRPHAQCADKVRSIRRGHLDHPTEDYIDIAYNLLVCEHGYVYEGRGARRRTGANGNATLNSRHYAVCALLGSSGLTEPSDAMLHGLRDAIEYLREHGGAGGEIRGHRDGYATACPGKALYAWVKAGGPRPGKPPAPEPPPVAPPFPGRDAFRIGRSHPAVTVLDRQLIRLGFARHHDGDGYQPGPRFTEYTRANVADFQRSRAELRGDPDGFPGPLTWRLLHTC